MTNNGTFTVSSAGGLINFGTLTNNGTLTIDSGTWGLGMWAGSTTGNLVDNGTCYVYDSSNLSYAGNLSGTGILEKNGAGTLTLSGDNTFSGGVIIYAGTIVLAHRHGHR